MVWLTWFWLRWTSLECFTRAVQVAILVLAACCIGPASGQACESYRLGTFSADVTIPLGHRCMGVLPTKAQVIDDPLFAHGFVLLGDDHPLVFVAIDWCEIRNGAYDQWREALAQAAGTTRDRVLVAALHQHDAPVVDRDAARLLAEVHLSGELYDEDFHDRTVQRLAQAVRQAAAEARPVTHLGIGEARVERVASNRRIVLPSGQISFARGSRSGGDPLYRDADEGEIDPFLKTLSFWDGEQPRLALHVYATHPMSHYGRGHVSADFVGLARQRRQRDDFSVMQIYASGCSGDVTAGKYNDGAPERRAELAERLYQAMLEAWRVTRRIPLEHVDFRNESLQLEFHPAAHLEEAALVATLRDDRQSTEARILAAMGLASRRRVASGQPIDLPCIDFGAAQLVLLPGESFVGFQLEAQRVRPDSLVLAVGYGECWTGYIPTASAWADGFEDKWLWVAPGSERRLVSALHRVLANHDLP